MLFCVVQLPVQTMCVCCVTYLLAAGQGAALSPDSTEWTLAPYIHTAAALGLHTAERASRTDDNTKREGCGAEGSPLPRYLEGEQ